MRVRRRRALVCLWICFALFAGSVFVEFAAATTSDLLAEVDELTMKIQETPDDCWVKPSSNRKATMINKLNALRALVEEENFEEAYDKLLFDIKPKLTGLKTDENEEPWSPEGFKNPWVVCEELQEELGSDCNELLSHVKVGSAYDDDVTPPTISIGHVGGGFDGAPGFWTVLVEDTESGLDDVEILVDGSGYVHDQGLAGVQSAYYEVPVPASLDWHSVQVAAVNYDVDWDGDQESASEEAWICIIDDDITAPIIMIEYSGSGDTSDPGLWGVHVEDAESGLDEVQILVNEVVAFYDQGLVGIQSLDYEVSVPDVEGSHTVLVTAMNYDVDWDGDQESSSEQMEILIEVYEEPEPPVDDDTEPPVITISYVGEETTENPGVWNVVAEDIGSGLDEVIISVDGVEIIHDSNLGGIASKTYDNIAVPAAEGVHTIQVYARDYDIDWVGDQQEITISHTVDIVPIEPPPIIIG